MAPNLSEEEVDDLLYFARTGETVDFQSTVEELCSREKVGLSDILGAAKDESSGNGPLHMAAANGHADLLKTLLNSLANPPQNPALLALLNAQNGAGNTPLHWAGLNGHLDAVKALIDAGSDPTITNKVGHDAVYEAELNDRREVVEWVLRESEGLERGFGGDGEGQGEGEDGEEVGDAEGIVQGEGESQEDALRKGLGDLGIKSEERPA